MDNKIFLHGLKKETAQKTAGQTGFHFATGCVYISMNQIHNYRQYPGKAPLHWRFP